jgi:transcriptional regulator with XRE-family HTH domain
MRKCNTPCIGAARHSIGAKRRINTMLSHRLDALRQGANLTYKELAQICNSSETTISRICKGETSEPAFSTVASMVIACGGSLDELVGIESTAPKKSGLEMQRDYYEERIACIKRENAENIDRLTRAMEKQSEIAANDSAAMAEELSHVITTGDRKVRFVIIATAVLIVLLEVVGILGELL